MIFNILQQLECFFFSFRFWEGLYFVFLRVTAMSLNLIEISPSNLSFPRCLRTSREHKGKQSHRGSVSVLKCHRRIKKKDEKRRYRRHESEATLRISLDSLPPNLLLEKIEKAFSMLLYHLLSLLDDFNKTDERVKKEHNKASHLSPLVSVPLAKCKDIQNIRHDEITETTFYLK